MICTEVKWSAIVKSNQIHWNITSFDFVITNLTWRWGSWNGMNDFSYFTNSLHYAMHHSEISNDQSSCKQVEVLAMAVIFEASDRLGQKEAKRRHPTYEYSLPLYIITVKKD